MALFALRCDDAQQNGGPDPAPDPGCPGTQGELERIDFVFEELAWQDLSQEGGLAFATGTQLGFRARAVEEDDVLPALRVTSEAPGILSATTDPDATFPHQLSFLQSGTASLTLLDDADVLVDRLTVRVADPAALALWVGPLLAEPLWLDSFAEEPARLFLAPGGGARLAFALANDEGDAMPGRWNPETEQEETSPLVALPEGRLSVGTDSWVPIQLLALLEVEGDSVEDTLTLRGPGGLWRSLSISVDATPILERLDLVLPATSDEGEAEGTERIVTVMGHTPDGVPALGYPMRIFSSDPRVASVTPRPDAPDAATVRFLAAGEVTLTAVPLHDPTLSGSLTLKVAPSDP